MILDQITQMRKQGIPANQIIQSLRQQGISPKEINEALSQSEIKNEITNQTDFSESPDSDMRPSLSSSQENSLNNVYSMEQNNYPYNQQQTNTQDYPEYHQGFSEPQTQDSNKYADNYEPYNYPQYQESGESDIETINDISSQIVEEKIKNFKKEFSNFINFKKESENKIDEIDKRLAKIEEKFEGLQMAIIRKIGDYGEDIKNLSKEIKYTQDSFGKIINPLAEKAKEIKDKEEKNPKQKPKKEDDSFENYLR